MYEAGRTVHARLTEGLQVEIQNFWLYPERRLIVVMLDSPMTVNKLMQVFETIWERKVLKYCRY